MAFMMFPFYPYLNVLEEDEKFYTCSELFNREYAWLLFGTFFLY